ncbi:MAG TPA: hypothetical protein VG389_23710 [Myxococcota bacterium]|jgi:hypothetical protein|nr:hypothetical protein [Myxococcota bacterium]
MNRKFVGAALGALIVSLAVIPEAAAEFSLKMGTRWEPLRYTFAVRSVCPGLITTNGCVGSATAPGVPSESGLGSFQNLDLNPYIGIGFSDRFSLNLLFDFATYTDTTFLNPPTRIAVDSASYWQLGVKLGMKLYLSVPKREQIAAYIWVDVYKYFAGVHDPTRTVTDPADRFAAALRSPVGFDLAFGMEYFFNKFFSVGSEIFGLRYNYARAFDGSGASGGLGFLNCVTGDCASTVRSRSYIAMYTLFTMNFHVFGLLEIRAKVYTKDDEGASAPPPKKKPADDEEDDDKKHKGDDGDDGDDGGDDE